ncbi:50S ribosomal protein L32e [Candidatus Woesearchaeota archaeon]|nr:50S ribosomal protein L32e [Candidatus Woesearchaeota archaeon]MBW3006057.1 50S ribosomal protein L32e [Candidatus Woesearchaeota archaeon]
MSVKESLDLRKKIKSKKPKYLREEHHKKKAVNKKSWRGPRGRHSKMRHGFQGHRATLEVGYGSPREARHLHSSGLLPVVVCNIAELSALDKSRQAAVISCRVGNKKKVVLVNKAKELGLKIINVKDITAFLKKIDDQLKAKKEKKETAAKDKAAKKKEKEKKAEEKAKKAAEAPEDSKKKETKELEKVLTKRER